jgi:Rrf2 family nitric oxide-sensitive transcriptional repressor
MQLNHFTDFGMRSLIFLNHLEPNKQSSLDELSKKLAISRNHLIKVVQFLSNNNLIIARRGQKGGILISEKGQTTPLGDIIHLLEQQASPVMDCNAKPCIFIKHNCKLKSIFNLAYASFIGTLNGYTVKDLTFDNWGTIFE